MAEPVAARLLKLGAEAGLPVAFVAFCLEIADMLNVELVLPVAAHLVL
jgi:hypothetical protein